MRLHERDAQFARIRGVVTVQDIERDRRNREAQERRREERERQAAKEATLGPVLLEVTHG